MYKVLVEIACRRHGNPLHSILSDDTRLVLHTPAQEENDITDDELYQTVVMDSEEGKVLQTLV